MTLAIYEGPNESAAFVADGRTFAAERGVVIDVSSDIAAALPSGWVLAGQSSSAVVVADATVPDGTTDNTTYLAGRLTVAMTFGVALRIPAGKNGNWVVNHFTLPSNASVDATGATFAQASGTNTRMILNTSLTLGTPGSARDSNISWTGGMLVKGTGQANVGNTGATGSGLDDHVAMFGFVDGLIVKNLTISQAGTGGNSGTGGRYGCYVYNCTEFYFENYTANSASQSVNQSSLQFQYCQGGHVKGVYGTFGDDCVALVNGNLAGDMPGTIGASNMENIQIENVLATSPSNGVRVMPGSTTTAAPFYNVQYCQIRNVRGSFASRAGPAGAVYFGGSTGYPNLQGGTVQDIEVTDVNQTLANKPAVYIDQYAEVSCTLRRINNQQDVPAITVPFTGGATNHQRLKITDCTWTTAITTGSYYPISVASTLCRVIELDNIMLVAATTGTATVAPINGTGGPGLVVARNVRTIGKAYLLGVFSSTTRIEASSVTSEDTNCVGLFQSLSGATINIRGWNGNISYGTAGFVQTAGSVTTNDCRVPGFSGTVTLAAGTATVSVGTGMVTSTSQIRLTTLTPGGTVGHCYVNSRSAGSFVIDSTSGSDASTILWEIVNS
jgi:hypothetical protein